MAEEKRRLLGIRYTAVGPRQNVAGFETNVRYAFKLHSTSNLATKQARSPIRVA